MADVFMSYSREDKHVARTVATALEAEGFSVWWDAALRAGEAYDEVTERNLRQASAVVVLWSKRSVNSKWVRAEATVGERSSVLVPALIDECDRPIRFELVQTADLTRWHGDRSDPNWRDFVSDIRSAVGESPASAAAAPPASAANGDDVTIETTFWTSVKDGNDRSDFEAYLARYPHGHFAALAQNRIAALDRASEASRAAAAAPAAPVSAEARPVTARPAAAKSPPPPAVEKKKSNFGAIIGAVAFVGVLGIAVTFALLRREGPQDAVLAADSEQSAVSESAIAAQQIPDDSENASQAEEMPEGVAQESPAAMAVDGSADAEELPEMADTHDGAPIEEADAIVPLADETEDIGGSGDEAAGSVAAAVEESGGEAAAPANASEGASETYRDCESCPMMARLPGGSFLMGSPATEAGRNAYEGPQREVTVKPFAMGVFEVSEDEWDACVTDGACTAKRSGDDGTLPVLGVSWREARAYAKWLSKKTGKTYRLPTEAEWEYAARAGATTAYWWGESFDKTRVALGAPKPVGSFEANAFGLYDLLGNAREWVEDCYVNNYRSAPTDGSAVLQGDCSLRVIRGGAWSSSQSDMRIANRSRIGVDTQARYMGLRLVSDLP